MKRTLSWAGCPQGLYCEVVAEEESKGEVRDGSVMSNDLQTEEKWIAKLRKGHGS